MHGPLPSMMRLKHRKFKYSIHPLISKFDQQCLTLGILTLRTPLIDQSRWYIQEIFIARRHFPICFPFRVRCHMSRRTPHGSETRVLAFGNCKFPSQRKLQNIGKKLKWTVKRKVYIFSSEKQLSKEVKTILRWISLQTVFAWSERWILRTFLWTITFPLKTE